MGPRRTAAVALAAALALVMALSGCTKRREEPTREGLSVKVNGLSYTVFITRQLNIKDPEDRDYFKGPDAPPNFVYYGVFIEVCNETKQPHPSALNFRIVDTQGDQFQPTDLPSDNIFAYRPQTLDPRRCLPEPGSAAATGPTGGSLLLFKLPVSAGENRPLDLEVAPSLGGESPKTQRIELDI